MNPWTNINMFIIYHHIRKSFSKHDKPQTSTQDQSILSFAVYIYIYIYTNISDVFCYIFINKEYTTISLVECVYMCLYIYINIYINSYIMYSICAQQFSKRCKLLHCIYRGLFFYGVKTSIGLFTFFLC